MDVATIAGLLIAFTAVLGGQALEGGSISSILQLTAGLIVLGGTLGAVVIQFPADVLKRAALELRQVFRPDPIDSSKAMTILLALAGKARRDGLIAIEQDVEDVTDTFMRRGLQFAVDGTDVKMIRSAMELELSRIEEEAEMPAKVLEAAGGYSPTVGIIGAVLGLIHVMENLSDPTKLGGGIAVAFVATVYGVSLANLVLLPMAAKMKHRARQKIAAMEVTIEGVCALAEGENPRLIERKLSVLVTGTPVPAATPVPAKPVESVA